MNRYARDNRPNVKKVEKIVLPERISKWRYILFALFLVIAIVSIGAWLFSLLHVDAGWQPIEANTSDINCSDDFNFQYNIGADGSDAATQRRELVNLYNEMCIKADQVFNAYAEYEGNLYDLNHHPNQTVVVDSLLYNALQHAVSYSNYIYLGPIYESFDNVFNYTEETDIRQFDPGESEEVAEFVKDIVYYVNKGSISLEFKGNNSVVLNVDEDYLKYATESEINNYLDFYWLKNAYIIDYFKQQLKEKGLTDGYIISNNGYAVNLCDEVTFTMEFYHYDGKDYYDAYSGIYQGPMAVVCLKNYPVAEYELNDYVIYSGDKTLYKYFDDCDGVMKSALNELYGFSKSESCADIVAKLSPLFISDYFDAQSVNNITDIKWLYIQDKEAITNAQDLIQLEKKFEKLYSE